MRPVDPSSTLAGTKDWDSKSLSILPGSSCVMMQALSDSSNYTVYIDHKKLCVGVRHDTFAPP